MKDQVENVNFIIPKRTQAEKETVPIRLTN